MIQDFIEEGIKKELISISEDGKQITYLKQGKKRNFTSPEEKVQAETFVRLVLEFGYPVENIEQFKTVTMGSEKREADIVVYDSPQWEKPIIVIECKKEEVSQQEFEQAIKQAFSYASALPGSVKFIWVTSKILNRHFKFDKEKETRQSIGSLPYYGSDKVAPYNYVKGGGKHKYIDNGKEITQDFSDLKVIPESELIKVFKQSHDALWAGGQLNPSEAFDELDKLIFCKIWDEKYNIVNGKLIRRKKGEIYDFQVIEEKGKTEEEARKKTNAALAKRIKTIYKAGKEFDKEVFKDDIRLSDERIRTIVGYFESVSIDKTDLDSKGRAFETFLGSFFRGEFGQYFTPRVIVQFIVESLPIDNHSLVLDTSCGSGGFLLHALDKVRRQADKEYPDHETDAEERELWKEYWHSFASKNLYGIEINEQIARTAKMNMIIHDDGHTNVISLDGLLSDKDVKKNTENTGFTFNRFDFIITNPPFGSSIKSTEKNYLSDFVLGRKEPDWLAYNIGNSYWNSLRSDDDTRNNQSTEILFLEQCHKYLKEKGYLAVVIPDGILTNSSLQYVRDQIEDWYRIVAVVSMPQTAFTATGAGVKSSVLFLRKNTAKYTEKSLSDKDKLKQSLIKEQNYYSKVATFIKEKEHILKDFTDYPFEYSNKVEEKKSERFKEWRAEISAACTEKINDLKEQMRELFIEKRKEYFRKNPKEDYPIFMAIAENIGYDAAGKACSVIVKKEEFNKGTYKTIKEHLRHDLFDEKIEKKLDLQGVELETKKEVLPEGILKELQKFIKSVDNGSI